jgi:hypothetical protein
VIFTNPTRHSPGFDEPSRPGRKPGNYPPMDFTTYSSSGEAVGGNGFKEIECMFYVHVFLDPFIGSGRRSCSRDAVFCRFRDRGAIPFDSGRTKSFQHVEDPFYRVLLLLLLFV